MEVPLSELEKYFGTNLSNLLHSSFIDKKNDSDDE